MVPYAIPGRDTASCAASLCKYCEARLPPSAHGITGLVMTDAMWFCSAYPALFNQWKAEIIAHRMGLSTKYWPHFQGEK